MLTVGSMVYQEISNELVAGYEPTTLWLDQAFWDESPGEKTSDWGIDFGSIMGTLW
jgi:hypothetical protein